MKLKFSSSCLTEMLKTGSKYHWKRILADRMETLCFDEEVSREADEYGKEDGGESVEEEVVARVRYLEPKGRKGVDNRGVPLQRDGDGEVHGHHQTGLQCQREER